MDRIRLAGLSAIIILCVSALLTGAYTDNFNPVLPGIGPSIQDAINATADGGTLFVPAVVISRIHLRRSQWWVVTDSENPLATLTITDGVPPEIRIRQTVDVQGQLYWSGGQPCLRNVQCWAYTDSAATFSQQRLL